METKSEQIRIALRSGDAAKALSLASKFSDRGSDTRLYKQAQAAAHNPAFYRQIGKDPEKIVASAVQNLKARFL